MKFLDISQPKMWGFNLGLKQQGARDNSMVERADERRNTFLQDYKQKSIHSLQSMDDPQVVRSLETRTVNPNSQYDYMQSGGNESVLPRNEMLGNNNSIYKKPSLRQRSTTTTDLFHLPNSSKKETAVFSVEGDDQLLQNDSFRRASPNQKGARKYSKLKT